jgi:hypothetical protein
MLTMTLMMNAAKMKHHHEKKRKLISGVEKSLKQSKLKVFKGISVPFTREQIGIVKQQFLRATISANLPFRWTEDIEVVKLFLLLRSTAADVIPARKVLAGTLLNDASQMVETQLVETLKGKYGTLS